MVGQPRFWQGKRVMVTGGAGFLGSYVVRALVERGCAEIVVPRRREYDLREMAEVRRLFEDAGAVDVVIHLAAKVGGIGFNQALPGELFYDNLMLGSQVMEVARRRAVSKFVAIGTICAYPKHCPVPFREDELWSGYPDETNAPYGLAKKMLVVQAQAYRRQYGFNAICLLPTNLYGPGDDFDPRTSHVIPALIRRCDLANRSSAPRITVWGDGRPTREFLYVEDAAEGVLLAAERYDGAEPVNLGSGSEISIHDLAAKVADITGFRGEVAWDADRPNGQPRRRLDTRRAAREFGFRARVGLDDGLRRTVAWYMRQQELEG